MSDEDPIDWGDLRSIAPQLPPSTEARRGEGSRWEVRATVAWGGMGRVDLVHDGWLDRDVARKRLQEGRTDERLWREARITARLEHPNIIPVYDAGVASDGHAWYAMRLVGGRSLADHVAQPHDRLALVRALWIASQAVAYAHEQGIAHRDLSLDNVLLGRFSEVQVVDWGIAAPLGAEGRPEGTPGSSDPEQLRGAPVSARHDVYALGRALHHLLHGRRCAPDTPWPDDAPLELRAVVAHATAPDGYDGVAALSADLEAWLSGGRVGAHDYSPTELLRRTVHAWRTPLLVLGSALTVTLGVGAWALQSTRAARDAALAATHEAQTRLAQLEGRRALDAFAVGDLVDAGDAAQAVLAIHPDDPSARGLSTAAGARAWTAVETTDAPCGRPRLLADGTAVCGHGHEATVHRWGEAVPLATLRASTPIRDVMRSGDGWWISSAADEGVGAHHVRVDRHGVVQEVLRLPALDLWASGQAVLVPHDTEGLHRDPLLGVDQATPCPEGIARLAGAVRAGVGAAWNCGAEVAWRLGGREGVLSTEGRDAFALDVVPEGVLVAWLGQGLSLFRDGVEVWNVPHGGDGVFKVDASGDRVVVQPQAGAPAIHALHDGALLASLPSSTTTVDLDDHGVTWVDDRGWHRARWAAPAWPVVIPVPAGVSRVGWLDADTLAIAHAEGHVVATTDRRVNVVDPPCGVRQTVFPQPDGRVIRACADHTAGLVEMGRLGEDPRILRPEGARDVLPWGEDRLIVTWGQPLRLTPDGQLHPVSKPAPASADATDDGLWVLDGRGTLHRWRTQGPDTEIGHDPSWGRVRDLLGSPVITTLHSVVRVDPDTGEAVWTWTTDRKLMGHDTSPDGRWIAVGTLDGTVVLLDAAAGTLRAALPGHTLRTPRVAFDPSGRWLATGSWDGTVRMWDLHALP